ADAEVGRNRERIPVSVGALAEAEGQLLALIQPQDAGSGATEWLLTTAPDLRSVKGSIQEDLAIAEKERPDLAALIADLQAAEVAAEVAKNRLLPQIDLVGTLGVVGVAGTIASDFATSGFGASSGTQNGLTMDQLAPITREQFLRGTYLDAFK